MFRFLFCYGFDDCEGIGHEFGVVCVVLLCLELESLALLHCLVPLPIILFSFDFGCLHKWQITHMEMIKGIKGHGYYDELVVPIIENTAYEYQLTESFAKAVCFF